MEWITKMQHAIDFIESNILEKIDSKIIAREIGTTPFHYQRLFHIICGVTVAEYIRRRRLTLAAQEIATTDSSIIDIALKYGYESHASFTKAFTRMHGIAPIYARERGIRIRAFPPLSFSLSIKGAVSMDYKIREVRETRIVGKVLRTTSSGGENLREIPRFWTQLNESGVSSEIQKLADPEGVFKGSMLGICMDFSETEERFDYMIAVESLIDDVPDDMEERIIPSRSYAVFSCEGGAPEKIQETWGRIFSEWFPATNYVHVNAPELEVYFCGDMDDPSNFRCDIWIPIELASDK